MENPNLTMNGFPNAMAELWLQIFGEKRLQVPRRRHQFVAPATDCQSRSRSEPSKTILPSPRRDGIQAGPLRVSVTTKGSPERVQRVVSWADSPQIESRIAVATAPVPHAKVSASTPRSNVR